MSITLGGKVYESADAGPYTLAYGLYMDQVLEEAGITPALSILPPDASDETRKMAAKAAWSALIASGKAPELLAGLLKPVEEPWTPSWAKATAPMLNNLESRDDQRQLTELLVTGVAAFFGVGPRSSQTFP